MAGFDFEERVESLLRKSVGINAMYHRISAQKLRIRAGLCRCFESFEMFNIYEQWIKEKLRSIMTEVGIGNSVSNVNREFRVLKDFARDFDFRRRSRREEDDATSVESAELIEEWNQLDETEENELPVVPARLVPREVVVQAEARYDEPRVVSLSSPSANATPIATARSINAGIEINLIEDDDDDVINIELFEYPSSDAILIGESQPSRKRKHTEERNEEKEEATRAAPSPEVLEIRARRLARFA